MIELFAFLVVAFSAITSFGLSMEIAEGEDCEILACEDPYIEISAMILGLLLFLPLMLLVGLGSTISGSQLLILPAIGIGTLLSFIYWIYLSKTVLKAYSYLKAGANQINKILPDESHAEKKDIDFFADYAPQFLYLFSLFMGATGFFRYPEYAVSLGFTDFMIMATAVAGISTYLFKNFEEELGEKGIRSLKSISSFSLVLLVFGAIGTVLGEPNIDSVYSEAMFNAFHLFTIAGGSFGLLIMLILPTQMQGETT